MLNSEHYLLPRNMVVVSCPCVHRWSREPRSLLCAGACSSLTRCSPASRPRPRRKRRASGQVPRCTFSEPLQLSLVCANCKRGWRAAGSTDGRGACADSDCLWFSVSRPDLVARRAVESFVSEDGESVNFSYSEVEGWVEWAAVSGVSAAASGWDCCDEVVVPRAF